MKIDLYWRWMFFQIEKKTNKKQKTKFNYIFSLLAAALVMTGCNSRYSIKWNRIVLFLIKWFILIVDIAHFSFECLFFKKEQHWLRNCIQCQSTKSGKKISFFLLKKRFSLIIVGNFVAMSHQLLANFRHNQIQYFLSIWWLFTCSTGSHRYKKMWRCNYHLTII